LECFGGAVSDGVEDFIGIYCRDPLHEAAPEDILAMLLRGQGREAVLEPVCNVIGWREHGSRFAISWEDGDGIHQVSTALPDLLAGTDLSPGTPWAQRRNLTGGRVEGATPDLPDNIRSLAEESGLTMYWVERVDWSPAFPPALLTLWTRGGTVAPSVHAYGMSVASNLVELILGWTQQLEEMSRAARLDSLTGLANRRTFFAELSRPDRGGALLYCDLDNFKPVNDTHGHAAGDALLALVARRIEACVRQGDIVARLGGDEFAVLCEAASLAEASDVAERIRDSLGQPFAIGETEAHISVSVGVASDARVLDEQLLGLADRALYEAKYGGGDAVRATGRGGSQLG
jgi:diguanylate cyclase (GGDEF)-like protein